MFKILDELLQEKKIVRSRGKNSLTYFIDVPNGAFVLNKDNDKKDEVDNENNICNKDSNVIQDNLINQNRDIFNSLLNINNNISNFQIQKVKEANNNNNDDSNNIKFNLLSNGKLRLKLKRTANKENSIIKL